MTDFYSDLAKTATQLIAQYGRDVVLRKSASDTGGADYNPATGVNTPPAPTDFTLKGALFDFGSGAVQYQGTLIEQGDKKLILEPKQAPALADQIIIDAVAFNIVGIRSSNPAGTPVAYTLHLRR